MFRLIRLAPALLVLSFAAAALADEVRMKNGDRITGKISEASGGKLKVSSAVAGDLTVDLKDVQTFSTDAPVEVRLKNGRVLRQRLDASDTAGAATAADGTPVTFADVKSISTKGAHWTGALVVGGLLTRGNSDTITVYVFSKVRSGITPTINALALILIMITIVGAIAYEISRRRKERALAA